MNFFAHLGVSLVPTLPETTSFGGIIVFVYQLAFAIVGLAVFIQFVRAGWKYLSSAGNASKAGEARTLMTNAVIGIILLVSAYMILNIINPDLADPTKNRFDGKLQELIIAGEDRARDRGRNVVAIIRDTEISERGGATIRTLEEDCGVRYAGCTVGVRSHMRTSDGETMILHPSDLLMRHILRSYGDRAGGDFVGNRVLRPSDGMHGLEFTAPDGTIYTHYSDRYSNDTENVCATISSGGSGVCRGIFETGEIVVQIPHS
jgi:low affinity Fe/Cu permease